MINKSWKSIVWATTTIIAVGSLSACSGGAQGSNTNSSGQQQTKPGETPTVTILMSKSTNFPETNPVIDQIRKKQEPTCRSLRWILGIMKIN